MYIQLYTYSCHVQVVVSRIEVKYNVFSIQEHKSWNLLFVLQDEGDTSTDTETLFSAACDEAQRLGAHLFIVLLLMMSLAALKQQHKYVTVCSTNSLY